jgi:general secretion pathway protein J
MKSRGFSMLEALVAVALLAMMGMVTFGTFGRALDARERATTMTDRYHELRSALVRMSLEMSQAFLSKHKDYAEPRTQTLFATRTLHGGMRLDFTSFSHYKYLKDANECDQNELSYFVEPDRKQGSRSHLMRREQKRIDEKADEGGDVDILARDVTKLTFSFYNPRSDKWEDAWDSRQVDTKDRLPKYAAITIEAIDHNGNPMTIGTKLQFLLQDALLITGSGFSPGMD